MIEWNISIHDRLVQSFKIEEGQTLTIGRSKDANVKIDNTGISRFQASMRMKDGKIYIEDTDSLNGTFVNGNKIQTQTLVSENDRIDIGKFTFSMAPKNQTANAGAPDFEATMYVPSKTSKKRGAKLRLLNGEAEPTAFQLQGRTLVNIGKGKHCDIKVKGFFLGAVQCSLAAKGDGYCLTNRGRWRRTTLNNENIDGENMLKSGDVIGLGRVKIQFLQE